MTIPQNITALRTKNFGSLLIRHKRAAILIVVFVTCVSVAYSSYHLYTFRGVPLFQPLPRPLPHLFPEIWEQEDRLPQHDLSLPPPEGINGRYIRFENQMWGNGVNNQLQEMSVFCAAAWMRYLAHRVNPIDWC